jgi:hypothetical protein
MNKENMIDSIDDIVPLEKQISLTLPKSQLQGPQIQVAQQEEYKLILSDLILLALPSPSQHVH